MNKSTEAQPGIGSGNLLGGIWKPIQSAPKTGTPIDLWHPRYGRLTNYKRVKLSKTNVFYDPVKNGVCVVRDATYWMPIPKPPNDSGEPDARRIPAPLHPKT